jgi:alkanesulfonate monooxygenase SsuD/methylene tetrahydromethanopterin reductase-like flavin-dependent oxidoreductase (luciferase family)
VGGLVESSLVRCGRIGDGWLGASCTPEEARVAKATIEAAARQADRRVDPEHFGISIGYTHRPLDERQLAALAARWHGRVGDGEPVDPRALVPVGHDALRTTLRSFIDVGMSKFVLRPMSPPDSWHDELAGLADAVLDLQT